MVNGTASNFILAVALACGLTAVSGNAVRAATGDTSTTVAAAPATRSARTPVRVQRPRWLGVAMQKIPPVFSRLMRLKSQQGLMVLQVIPNSPAYKAHLEPGDLLITLNGQALENPFELIGAENQPGPAAPALKITLIRDGMRKSVTLTPVNRPHHLIFFFNRRSGPAGAVPAGTGSPNDIQTTSLMTVGPGVRLHIPAAAVQQSGDRHPDLFTVRQWIGPHGARHIQILWRSRAYEIQPGRLNRLPPPVQAVARLILRGHAQSCVPAPSQQTQIQQRIAEVKTLIHKLQIQEKALEKQAANYHSVTPAKP